MLFSVLFDKYLTVSRLCDALRFRLDPKELIRNGKIVTSLENGRYIESEASNIRLDGESYLQIMLQVTILRT